MKDVKLLKLGRLKVSFAWYDLWFGFFIDSDKKRLYICPIPTLLFTISL